MLCKKKQTSFDSLPKEDKRCPWWCVAIIWCFIVLITFVLIFVIALYVIFPLVFMGNPTLHQLFMFPYYDEPSNPQYENFTKYNITGVHNFYVDVKDLRDSKLLVRLGVWQILPNDMIKTYDGHRKKVSEKALRESTKPIVIYFHGNGGTRIKAINTYQVLRNFFHVIAFDYRSYADSTKAEMTELSVIHDAVQLYQWVQLHTNRETYVWAHSLGTAISTHTVKKLYDDHQIIPKGLILEAPFTTMREEIKYHPVGSYFSWLPWFTSTILEPLEESGFYFRTETNILSVKCPIMIMHSVDDATIPYKLGKTLAQIAKDDKEDKNTGFVHYHEIESKYKCGHNNIYTHPDLPLFITAFLDEVRRM